MRTKASCLLLLLLFAACALAVGACNTVRGAAEDVRQAGEATEHAVNELTR